MSQQKNPAPFFSDDIEEPASVARLAARPETAPEALLEPYGLEALQRYRGRPEFQVMAAVSLLKQVAREFDPTITNALVHWSEDRPGEFSKLEGVHFERRRK